jgi:hypothetical protein
MAEVGPPEWDPVMMEVNAVNDSTFRRWQDDEHHLTWAERMASIGQLLHPWVSFQGTAEHRNLDFMVHEDKIPDDSFGHMIGETIVALFRVWQSQPGARMGLRSVHFRRLPDFHEAWARQLYLVKRGHLSMPIHDVEADLPRVDAMLSQWPHADLRLDLTIDSRAFVRHRDVPERMLVFILRTPWISRLQHLLLDSHGAFRRLSTLCVDGTSVRSLSLTSEHLVGLVDELIPRGLHRLRLKDSMSMQELTQMKHHPQELHVALYDDPNELTHQVRWLSRLRIQRLDAIWHSCGRHCDRQLALDRVGSMLARHPTLERIANMNGQTKFNANNVRRRLKNSFVAVYLAAMRANLHHPLRDSLGVLLRTSIQTMIVTEEPAEALNGYELSKDGHLEAIAYTRWAKGNGVHIERPVLRPLKRPHDDGESS